MSDNFYRAFEERHYAPREVIKNLRRQYLPFIAPLANIYPNGEAFDAGCGRGEWLELMLEYELKPFGIDLDEGMLSACVESDLPAQQGDAVEYMHQLSDSSQVAVTAFHVVEHIPFESLRTFVKEAFRVLKPGGILIMETPNPENLVVASNNFYLDPTHQKPIPAQLLAFVTEHEGFEKNKVVRLQESASIRDKAALNLIDVLEGVSPDYAVIAQKPGYSIEELDAPFNAEYGVGLSDLATAYQRERDKESKRLGEGLTELAEIRTRLQANEERLAAAQQHIANVEDHLVVLYSSRSWRLTAPLRQLSRAAQHIKVGIRAWLEFRPGSRPRRLVGNGASAIYRYIIVRPRLRNSALGILRRFPRLYYFLRVRMLKPSSPRVNRSESSYGTGTDFTRVGPWLPLDAPAQRYYQELVCGDFRKDL